LAQVLTRRFAGSRVFVAGHAHGSARFCGPKFIPNMLRRSESGACAGAPSRL